VTTHVLALRGCTPSPLAGYLKALGLFRLVAQQVDPRARAFWKDDVFHLVSTLDEARLLHFLCDEVEPTPMVSPWNGGSGFYAKDNHAALDAIASSKSPRLAAFRAAIAAARAVAEGLEERPKDEAKDAMLTGCRRAWAEASLAWLDAAVSLTREGEGKYPALLGTGGNDGRLDFTNNVMQRWVDLFDPDTGAGRPGSIATARASLFGTTERGLISAAIGQFHPGGAGGANAVAGFDADSLFNPWDFVLALEGAATLRVASLRRLDGGGVSLAAAPFALHGLPGGYGSATEADDEGRGEQWLPLWEAPATFPELRALFAEGRLVCGRERPRNALDAARAIAQLGSARGVSSFVRYAFMVRNGLSNLAVPVMRVETRASPLIDARLLDEIMPWLEALRGAADDKHAPPAFGRALRRIQGIILDLCTRSTPGPREWSLLLEELGAAEDLLVRSSRFTVARRLKPLPRLSARWIAAADDGTPEFELAAAVASARAPRRDGKLDTLGPLRAHCLPLDPARRHEAFSASDDALRDDPRVVWSGSDLTGDLARIVARRAMESAREGFDGLAISGGSYASLQSLSDFIAGATDDARIARLARGMMAVQPSEPRAAGYVKASPLYSVFRLANLDASAGTARALPAGVRPRCDAQTIRLLMAGRLDDAARLALARLGAMGLRPKLRYAAGDARLGQRLAASLAFPLDPRSLGSVLAAVTKPLDNLTTENS